MPNNHSNPDKWERRYEREKKARQQAEKLLEEKSSLLYEANKKLAKEVEDESSKYKREEEKFTMLFHHSYDGIIIQDHNGIILDANKKICEILGVTHAELVGMHIAKVPARDSISICVNALREISEHGSARFACHLQNRHKKRIPVDIAATKLQFGETILIQGIIRDVSEQQKARKDLEIATNTAIKANEAKSLFLATMSHEIRTPLNGVIGFTNLLLESELSKEQAEYLSLIKKSSDILLHIINDILDFSRIESGQMELEHVDYDLKEIIEDVLDIHAQTASAKQVDLVYYIDAEVSQYLHGDAGRLQQILLNLVSNGLKFTKHGAVSIEVKKPNENFIQFTVSDSGIGIDEAIKDQLFEPFLQADASTTRKFGGTGLGLAICRQLAEAMAGTISVNSEVGKGSDFIVTLPFHVAENEERFHCISSYPLKGVRVFILDDNLTNLDFMKARLNKWGCKVTTNAYPKEALAIIDAAPEQYDLILVDMLMPDMDGFDFAKELLKRKVDHLPMILVTSSREVKRKQVFAAGFVDLIYKPVKENVLLSSMLRVMDDKNILVDHIVSDELSEVSAIKQDVFVLIVEDNPINAKLAKLLIEKLGVIAHVAQNGQEALQALSEHGFYRIILMDMQMPVMDGIEATQRIRSDKAWEHYQEVPIVAMTASALPEDEVKCIAAGMDSYITKPIDAAKLERTLRQYRVIGE